MIKLFCTPKQREIIECTARKMGVFAGRRWGKTDTFFNRCIKRCLEGAPIEYLFAGPSYSLVMEQYERIVAACEHFIIRNVEKPHPRIEFMNGSRLHLRSFDKPKFSRGLRRIAEIWVDEIQDIAERAFWRVFRPMLSDVRGPMIVSGQFRGENWYYKSFYAPGLKPEQNYAKSWKLPSSTGLIFQDALGRQELEDVKADIGILAYREEYECDILASLTAVWQSEDLSVIKRGEAQDNPIPGHRYIISYDLGEHIDPSAEGIWDVDGELGPTLVQRKNIPLRQKHQVQAQALSKDVQRWNAACVIDGTAGGGGGHKTADENIKFYRDYIPDVHVMIWEPSVKAELVRRASHYIEGHKIAIPECFEDVHHQLSVYEGKRKNEGWQYAAPVGERDDQVAQVMMGCWAIKAEWFPDRRGISLSKA